MIKQLTIEDYKLDIIDIKEFKTYLEENEDYFSACAYKSYLKAVDIPYKFFKEQPIETQKELLDNREVFVADHSKYKDKVIVVVKMEKGPRTFILNACKLTPSEVDLRYKQLKEIEQVDNKFAHKSFIKDGYTTYIVSKDNNIKRGEENKVLVIDFPILLNKKPVIHTTLYTIPDGSSNTDVEHLHYLSNEEIDLDTDYQDIKKAINSFSNFFTDELEVKEAKDILREPEIVGLALVEGKVIPSSYSAKLGIYIKSKLKGVLDTYKLEQFVLDYEETFTSYKQITNLRSVDGFQILNILESDSFKEVLKDFEDKMEELLA